MKLIRHLMLSCCFLIAIGSVSGSEVSVKVIALFSDKAMLNIDGEKKILAKGESYKGVGLISASGRGAVVEINGEQRKLGLNQSIQGNFKSAARSTSRIYPDSLGMYFIDGKINGRPTRFLVDTGATFVTMSSQHAKIVGIDYRSGKRGSMRTATETVSSWHVYLRSITVGGIKLSNVEAAVLEGSQPDQVLLGNSFLGRTQIQRKGSVMELQKRF